MPKKGVAVISFMGLGAAFLGLLGLPLPFNAIYEIVDNLYAGGGCYFLQISYILRVLLIAVFFILPHFIYAVSSIELFFFRPWARKAILFAAPVSAISTILASLLIVVNPLHSPDGLRALSGRNALAYLADFYVIISAVIIIFFLRRPRVKELF